MITLHDDLEVIRQLNELRERSKELRQKGLRPLKGIKNINATAAQRTPPRIEPTDNSDNELYEKWFTSGNEVEVSLLIKVQNHKDLSLEDKENDVADAKQKLKERLQNLTIKNFFPQIEEVAGSRLDAQPTVSVLMAARIMQALVSRAETVFSKNTMLCYYRIIRELYIAGDSDYTFGAARAGVGAGTSAFVTGECVRAIFAFEDAINRTVNFLQNVSRLYERYKLLDNMLKGLKIDQNDNHPLCKWANRAIERMWLDCFLSTSPRAGEIALFLKLAESKHKESQSSDEKPVKNALLLSDKKNINLDTVKQYFDDFIGNLRVAIEDSKDKINDAVAAIEDFRKKEDPYDYSLSKRIPTKKAFEFKASDFKDIFQLCNRINKMKDFDKESNANTDLDYNKNKLANHLYDKLSEKTQKSLPVFIENNKKETDNNDNEIDNHQNEEFIKSFITDFNFVLGNETQRLTKFFHRSLLKRRTKKLEKKPVLRGDELFEFNRLVMEDAFPDEIKKNESKLIIDRFRRSESAHLIALQMIENALEETENSLDIFEEYSGDLEKILKELIALGKEISRRIHRVVEPTKQYIKNVIRRELSASPNMFDAGELVFAATAFGAMTDWKPNELLTRSCELLKESLPENGRLITKRPLHSTQRGYRLLPIGCEMTSCLAQLFQKTKFDIDPKLISRMINIFEEKSIPLSSKKGKEWVGWNFDGSQDPNKPSVWVTAVAVLALDRIVRMLNSQINRAVLKHFDVFLPEKPHVKLTLNDLIYPDAGFREFFIEKCKVEIDNYKKLPSLPIALELMRAHLMRVTLPAEFVKAQSCSPPIFSAIFYGPPGTGKTTLAEALALSSNVPVISLSPNDLLVEGQELMEGRARDVFEALSMLTQTVIILDEFEPILASRNRESFEDYQNTDTKVIQGEDNNLGFILTKFLDQIAGEIREISEKDDPKFQFLLGGMLPRLIKLYDVSKKQSLVYCLATNYLSKIDHAAKRTGRFDLKIPVYNPDPLSRAGTLLFRLSRIKKEFEDGFWDDNRLKRFKEVIVHTANEPASELSGRYYKIKEEDDLVKQNSEFLNYILDSDKTVSIDDTKYSKMESLFNKQNKPNLEDIEINERKWLKDFESKLGLKYKHDDLDKILSYQWDE